jgi:hypothetical protein
MLCPQCGVPTEAHIKYCKACGFRLVDFGLKAVSPDALTPNEAKGQLRRLKGTRTLVASLVFWLPTLFTMMVAASTNGPDQEIASIIAFFFVLLSFGSSGWGLINLWRGGFFKTYKEQRIRAEAALLAAQQSPALFTAKPEPVRLPVPHETPQEVAPAPSIPTSSMFSSSVTEHTTRSLPASASNSGKLG